MEITDQQDCETNISRIEELLRSGIFEPANSGHVLQQSAFIELMICLRDLVAKVEKYGERISFQEDILKNEYVDDVSDAIRSVRDACCHIDSYKRHFDENKNRGSFMVAYGKCNVGKINDLELKSEYSDDMAVFYGKNRLYFRRHIIRAYEEAKSQLLPYLPSSRFRNTT